MTYRFTTQKQDKRPPRRVERLDIPPNEAEKHALGLLRNNRLSPLEGSVVDLLAVAGVLTDSQLNKLFSISPSSLLRYYKNHLIDRVPVHNLKISGLGFPSKDRVYCLGMVGLAIAEIRAGGRPVPKGYIGYGVDRATHDILTNEVVIRLCNYARGRGYAPLWKSRYEATVRDNMGVPKIEPDAMLEIGRRKFVIEYHNEDSGSRARKKIDRYEYERGKGHCSESWGHDSLPTILVAFTHKAVATGYTNGIDKKAIVGFRYLGKPWASFQRGDNPALWQDFKTGEVVNVLE